MLGLKFSDMATSSIHKKRIRSNRQLERNVITSYRAASSISSADLKEGQMSNKVISNLNQQLKHGQLFLFCHWSKAGGCLSHQEQPLDGLGVGGFHFHLSTQGDAHLSRLFVQRAQSLLEIRRTSYPRILYGLSPERHVSTHYNCL